MGVLLDHSLQVLVVFVVVGHCLRTYHHLLLQILVRLLVVLLLNLLTHALIVRQVLCGVGSSEIFQHAADFLVLLFGLLLERGHPVFDAEHLTLDSVGRVGVGGELGEGEPVEGDDLAAAEPGQPDVG